MNWNKYIVMSESGLRQEFIIGEWFKPGKYSFGEVEFVRTLTDTEVDEYKAAEYGIMSLWYDQLPPEFHVE